MKFILKLWDFISTFLLSVDRREKIQEQREKVRASILRNKEKYREAAELVKNREPTRNTKDSPRK